MNDALDLDHVAVVVRDLDVAEQNYRRLGFQLTPRSSHSGPIPPDGHTGPWGTGNHCAMFHRGYFELLGITDPNRFKTHVDRRLAKYEGLHLIAFGSGDAKAAVRQMRANGAQLGDPAEIGRDVPYGSGTRSGRFAISNLDPDIYPEADFIVIEQITRDVLWQPSLLDHPNGVTALESVTVCTNDPAGFSDRMAPVLGPATGPGFQLSPGTLRAMTVDEIAVRFADYRPRSDQPHVAAVAMGVPDLEATRGYLSGNGIGIRSTSSGSVSVGPDLGCGAIVEFIETQTRDEPV